MANALSEVTNLLKALEAGNYNAAPSTLTQGSALMVEDLSPVMNVVTFDDEHIKLQSSLRTSASKSVLYQFDRQLSYGIFGGSATIEGAVGTEETSDFVRIVVPMSYYSHVRRVTYVANLVDTVDGKKAEERAAQDAALKLAGDIEFDSFRGKADFSNGGVFDGHPGQVPALPNMLGVDCQIRQSDSMRNSQDLMFGEYGSDDSVVHQVGDVLGQDAVEDAAVRSAMNFGNAERLIIDPLTLSAYNKLAFQKERIILAGSPQDATGADLRTQWVSGGAVKVESSRFLSAKTRPANARTGGPAAPASVAAAQNASSTSFKLGEVYIYYVTSVNEIGESVPTLVSATTIAVAGNNVVLTITHPGSGTVRYFNVYRSNPGGTTKHAKLIGRVRFSAGGVTTAFTDLNNRAPGAVTGFLIQEDTMEFKELSPYSRLKLAVTDLSQPEAHFRFLCLAVVQPRKNVILDNVLD